MDASAILQPVIVVSVLSVIMTFWMIGTRIPEMQKRGIHPQKAQNTSKLLDLLPPEITRISNNYNHLFEQPTVFYAVAISIAVLGHVDSIHVGCAWAELLRRGSAGLAEMGHPRSRPSHELGATFRIHGPVK